MQLPTLYKRTSAGKVQLWTIEAEGNQYRTIIGQQGGKMTESAWTTCKGKNIGRANETSPEAQAILEAEAAWTKKRGGEYRETLDEIDGDVFRGPMLAHDFSDYESRLNYEDGVFTQPKLDGMRCILSAKLGMVSRNGKAISGAPHIWEAAQPLLARNPGLILDGELYSHDLNQDFNHIMHLVRQVTPTEEELEESRNVIQYWVYDRIDGNSRFAERSGSLWQMLIHEPPPGIVLVPTAKVTNREALDAWYEHYLGMGFEGQMVRLNTPYEQKRSRNLLKRKEFKDAEFLIMDVIEGEGSRSGMAGAIKVQLAHGVTCDAGIRGGVAVYRQMWANREALIGQVATVKYFGITPDGKLRFPVVKEIGRAAVSE